MDGTSSCREVRTTTNDVNDMSIDELRARASSSSDHRFAGALVERVDRQERTIRELFADVVRLSIIVANSTPLNLAHGYMAAAEKETQT